MRATLRMLVRRPVPWIAVCITAGLVWLRCGPLPARLLDEATHRANQSTTVVDRHGEVLFESRSSNGTRTERLAGDEIPALVERATLAAEDGRFYRHPGIDPIAIIRATVRNVRAGHVVEGGSTISQQVAKLLMTRADGRR